MAERPQFSVLHTSARPELCRVVAKEWLSKAANPAAVEYVLCKDPRWGFDAVEAVYPAGAGGMAVEVVNHGRRCYVDGVNTAARAASGRIFIVNADDQYPCQDWDRLLLELIGERRGPFVVEVRTGTPDEHERGISVMPILSRERYEDLGYVFYPAYESMYADNDFCEHARRDGIVIDGRELPEFPHRHPLRGGVQVDEQYRAQNRPEAYDLGRRVFDARRAGGFGPVSAIDLVSSLDTASGSTIARLDGSGDAAGVRTIALCLSGENFRGEWVDSMLTLYTHMIAARGFNVIRLRNYTSNVYVTRLEIWEALKGLQVPPDFLFWLDDDNLCSPEQFDTLLADLENNSDFDVVAGWCWVHDREQKHFQVSCGNWSPDGVHWLPFDPVEFPHRTGLQECEVTGFPCVLMRGSVPALVGELPFIRGILDTRLQYGIGGEDLAFCRSCAGVCRIAVNPAVQVTHLKWMAVIPEFQLPKPQPFTLAVMLRVRNEARWISRVVESVKSLGPVFVLDDFSTDGTADLARAAGAVVISNPFGPDDLDERRDKNWLLEHVQETAAPDWVFCIDGDEELEPNGAEKIRRACASGVADMYSVRFLHFWNSPEHVRLDRWYSTFARFSLFRVLPGLSFKSLYEGSGVNVHSGLHTGNAPLGPGLSAPKAAALNVFMLHYGYMVREDRVRKFEYYNRVDPGNELEDRYRHVVQGDIPEVPADAVLRHAGPLDVRRLPRSYRPAGLVMPPPLLETVAV